MSRILHFGPPGHMKPIKMMQGGTTFSPTGHSQTSQYLSGRAGVQRSFGSHREFDMAWRGKRAELRHLLDCASGLFGEGPFFFIDPTWMDQNVLPPHWAAPSLAGLGAPPIYGERRPSTVPMPANDGTWPSRGGLFYRDTTADIVDLYLPIPPRHTLYFWYSGTPDAVRVTRQLGAVGGTTITPVTSDPSATLAGQTALSVASSASIDGARIRLNLTAALPSVTIYGMRAVLLPFGTTPAALKDKSFVGGQGHAGVQFDGHPAVTPYSTAYDSVGVTARLIEVDE